MESVRERIYPDLSRDKKKICLEKRGRNRGPALFEMGGMVIGRWLISGQCVRTGRSMGVKWWPLVSAQRRRTARLLLRCDVARGREGGEKGEGEGSEKWGKERRVARKKGNGCQEKGNSSTSNRVSRCQWLVVVAGWRGTGASPPIPWKR